MCRRRSWMDNSNPVTASTNLKRRIQRRNPDQMTEAAIKWPRVNGSWLRSPALSKVFSALTAEGADARVVGGAIRNALLDRPVTEIDIATTARPEEVMRL